MFVQGFFRQFFGGSSSNAPPPAQPTKVPAQQDNDEPEEVLFRASNGGLYIRQDSTTNTTFKPLLIPCQLRMTRVVSSGVCVLEIRDPRDTERPLYLRQVCDEKMRMSAELYAANAVLWRAPSSLSGPENTNIHHELCFCFNAPPSPFQTVMKLFHENKHIKASKNKRTPAVPDCHKGTAAAAAASSENDPPPGVDRGQQEVEEEVPTDDVERAATTSAAKERPLRKPQKELHQKRERSLSDHIDADLEGGSGGSSSANALPAKRPCPTGNIPTTTSTTTRESSKSWS